MTLDWKRRPKEDKEGVDGMSKGDMVWDAIGEQKEFGVGKRRWRVPLGHVWVEGDNASASKDSNTYGPVSCWWDLWYAGRMLTQNNAGLEVINCWKSDILSMALGTVWRKALGRLQDQDQSRANRTN